LGLCTFAGALPHRRMVNFSSARRFAFALLFIRARADDTCYNVADKGLTYTGDESHVTSGQRCESWSNIRAQGDHTSSLSAVNWDVLVSQYSLAINPQGGTGAGGTGEFYCRNLEPDQAELLWNIIKPWCFVPYCKISGTQMHNCPDIGYQAQTCGIIAECDDDNEIPTQAPTSSPTSSPTHMPTIHPCDDGSHGCDLASTKCVVYPGQAHLHFCQCNEGYVTNAGSTTSCLATAAPSFAPTPTPTDSPTVVPGSPSNSPTKFPTKSPTDTPTQNPALAPGATFSPTQSPTNLPTVVPGTTTYSPTQSPTGSPTVIPGSPSAAPTHLPTFHPCDDGSHGCDLSSTQCVVYPGQAHLHACQCREGYVSSANSDTSCSATLEPTQSPSQTPSPFPTPYPTESPTEVAVGTGNTQGGTGAVVGTGSTQGSTGSMDKLVPGGVVVNGGGSTRDEQTILITIIAILVLAVAASVALVSRYYLCPGGGAGGGLGFQGMNSPLPSARKQPTAMLQPYPVTSLSVDTQMQPEGSYSYGASQASPSSQRGEVIADALLEARTIPVRTGDLASQLHTPTSSPAVIHLPLTPPSGLPVPELDPNTLAEIITQELQVSTAV
jgi:hypothetical protein